MIAAHYSRLDRALHRMAFASNVVQDVLADVEASLYRKQLEAIGVARPIFITSLPRAGTTLVLELLANHPDTGSHTYRDMPFVRAPALWQSLAGSFRTAAAKAERAHGDGLMIDYDSPEGLEEVVWMRAFPGDFAGDGIALSRATGDEVRAALEGHIRRVLLARQRDGGPALRYLSKNNANVARIPALRAAFPRAIVLVPLRDPLEHARSLQRQYLRFAEAHGSEPFALRYMRDIGHFEFGELHRPIRFPRAPDAPESGPEALDYWLGYWIAAYSHLADEPGIRFIDYAGLSGPGAVGALFEAAGLPPDEDALRAGEALVHPPRPAAPEQEPPERLAEARELFGRLRRRSGPKRRN